MFNVGGGNGPLHWKNGTNTTVDPDFGRPNVRSDSLVRWMAAAREEEKHGDSDELGDLGTLTSMLLWGPVREHGMSTTAFAAAALTSLVWVVQLLCAFKLLPN